MDQAPFPEALQLNQQPRLDDSRTPIALCRTDHDSTALPGQARIELKSPGLDEYLEKELLVSQLDQLAPKLWPVCLQLIYHAGSRPGKGLQ